MKPLWKAVQIVRSLYLGWVAKDKSNTDCPSGSQQARVNGKSSHANVISVQCSECQSEWKQARVNGRSNYDNVISRAVL